MKRILTIVIAALIAIELDAQMTDPADHSDDIEVSVGIQGAPDTGAGINLRADISYSHFYKNGIGFRAGLSYMPENLGIDHNIGIPVSFAWRLHTEDGRPVGFKDSLDDDPYYESYYNNYDYNSMKYDDYGSYVMERFAENTISFLLALVSRLEFNAGFTPGYIFGADDLRYTGIGNDKTGMTVRNRFCLTADIGFKTSWRIWRFNMNMNPALHYSLTDNFRTIRHDGTFSDPHRLQLSIVFGIGFMF